MTALRLALDLGNGPTLPFEIITELTVIPTSLPLFWIGCDMARCHDNPGCQWLPEILFDALSLSFQVLLPINMTQETVRVVAEYFGLTPLVEMLNPPTPPSNQPRPHFPDILPLDVRGRWGKEVVSLTPCTWSMAPCHVFLFRKINVNRSFLTRYPNSYLAEMFSANSRYTPARLIFTMQLLWRWRSSSSFWQVGWRKL